MGLNRRNQDRPLSRVAAFRTQPGIGARPVTPAYTIDADDMTPEQQAIVDAARAGRKPMPVGETPEMLMERLLAEARGKTGPSTAE